MHTHIMSREFPEEPFGSADFDLLAEAVITEDFSPAVNDRPETTEQALTFPATQSAIAQVVGRSISTVHEKLTTLAKLHDGKTANFVQVFVDVRGEKRVSEQGFEYLQRLIAAGNIKNYRAQLDAIARPSQVPTPQISQPIAQYPQAGTPVQLPQNAHLSLVPTSGTPTQYSALGFPVATAQPLAYYQPTALAQNGAAMVGLADQLDAILTQALDDDFNRTQQELIATRSQRSRLSEVMPLLRAKVAAKRAATAQAAIALQQEKKSLEADSQELKALAREIGYGIEGLSELF